MARTKQQQELGALEYTIIGFAGAGVISVLAGIGYGIYAGVANIVKFAKTIDRLGEMQKYILENFGEEAEKAFLDPKWNVPIGDAIWDDDAVKLRAELMKFAVEVLQPRSEDFDIVRFASDVEKLANIAEDKTSKSKEDTSEDKAA